MDPTTLARITEWTGGRLIAGNPGSTATTLCTDSRALKAEDLFLALRGDNFDGHGFIAEAARRGAIGAVVEELAPECPEGFAQIQVGNTLAALQDMAACYRRSLPLKVLAITGSNGKTSTKDLSAAVLGQRFKVTATDGNFNNHIGLPLTMLRTRAADQVGVFEIGMNHPGEVAPLAAMAKPDAAIITNIGVAHIEFMGSRAAIAQEKGMLAEALPAEGHLILNVDDEYSSKIAARSRATTVCCGIGEGDVRASDVSQRFEGTTFIINAIGQECKATLAVPGMHMVRNALLAVGAGLVFGVTLEQCVEGLRQLQLTKGRLQQKVINGIRVLDDTYNANPDSVSAALRTLGQMPASGRRIAVLGRMGELGTHSSEGHELVGRVAAEAGIDVVIGVGAESALTVDAAKLGGVPQGDKVGSIEEALEALRAAARPGDIVLVKGSRSARMERIIEGLEAL